MILGLQKKAFGLVVLFTVIEIITLVVWLILALKSGVGNQVGAVVVLAVGLFLEHYISVFAGKANDVEPAPIVQAKK